uniref:Protein kinase domain-containing protein n=1 Tax=Myripristis murdjan TaxID=586833 RepID=A0A667Z4Q4_9TELE
MALPSHKAKLIEDESLEDWQLIGSGGFGQVYKARYKTLKIDVAIKLSRYCEGDEALQREASHLVKADSPFVLQVFGLYQGCPPDMGSDMQMGIVMEFMERGTLRSLLQLCRPPWPLAFRLAHQVALGMNFLHEIAHLLHTDLKPSNVLLDQSLNAKLADFGLSNSSTDTTVLEGGTLAYTAPEAFAETYQPVPAYDIYSYGILLWSILTGKEPYPAFIQPAVFTLLTHSALCITKFNKILAFVSDCLDVTECVYSRHKNGIRDAVNQVLMKLVLKLINYLTYLYLVKVTLNKLLDYSCIILSSSRSQETIICRHTRLHQVLSLSLQVHIFTTSWLGLNIYIS